MLYRTEFGPYQEGSRTVDSSAILWILAWSGVLSIAIFVSKGLLDQLPPLIESWRRFLRALHGDNESSDPANRQEKQRDDGAEPNDARPTPPGSHQ